MKKGISLIVLIVTVVVLLILAATATRLIAGQFGIINSTHKAVNAYNYEAAKEKLGSKLELIKLEAFTEGKTILEYMYAEKEDADTILEDITYEPIFIEDEEIVFHVDGIDITVDMDGEFVE